MGRQAVSTSDDDHGTNSSNASAAGSSGVVKAQHPVSVRVLEETVDVAIPHNFATNGWVLREAVTKYRATHGDPGAMGGLARADGSHVELGDAAASTLGRGETLLAVSAAAAGGAAVAGGGSGALEQVGMTTFTICVAIGDCELLLTLPDLSFTVGWLLSETIRRYMEENDDQDPGILGLQTDDGGNLDLAEEIVDVLVSGDVVQAVSYTVKAAKAADGARVVRVVSRRKKLGAKAKQAAEKREAPSMLRKFFGSSSGVSQRLATGDDEDGSGGGGGGGFQAVGGSDAAAPPPPPADSGSGSGTAGMRFKPLRDLVQEIEVAEARDRALVEGSRHAQGDRPSAAVTFDAETKTDPTGLIARYVRFSVDSLRLAVLDKSTLQPITSWRYEKIHGWVIGTTSFSIKVVQEWGLQQFHFTVSDPSVVSKALLERVNVLIRNRQHQKQQALLQKQQLAARMHAADGEVGSELAGLEDKKTVLWEGSVERQIDPSGTLSRHLLLQLTPFQLNVLDVTTRDVYFEWPYCMLFSWGLSKDLFVAAVSVAPPNERRASYNKHIKKGKGDTHYLTYAFKTAAPDQLQEVIRAAMDKVLDGGSKGKEVFVPQKLDEEEIVQQLQGVRAQREAAGGKVKRRASTTGEEQIFTFDESNEGIETQSDGKAHRNSLEPSFGEAIAGVAAGDASDEEYEAAAVAVAEAGPAEASGAGAAAAAGGPWATGQRVCCSFGSGVLAVGADGHLEVRLAWGVVYARSAEAVALRAEAEPSAAAEATAAGGDGDAVTDAAPSAPAQAAREKADSPNDLDGLNPKSLGSFSMMGGRPAAAAEATAAGGGDGDAAPSAPAPAASAGRTDKRSSFSDIAFRD